MRIKQNRFRLRLRLILFVFAMLPMTALILFIFYNLTNERAHSYSVEYEALTNEYSSGIKNNIDSFLRNLDYTSAIPELYQYLWGKRSTDMVDTLDFYLDLQRILHAIYQTNPYYNIITIYAADANIFTGDIVRPIQELPQAEREYVDAHSNEATITYMTEDGRYLKFYQMISAPTGRLGIVVSSVRLSELINSSQDPEEMSVFIYNPNTNHYHDLFNGNVVDEQMQFQKGFLIEKRIRQDIRVVFCISREALSEMQWHMQIFAGILIALSAVIVYLLVNVTSGLLTRKLYKLIGSITFQGQRLLFESPARGQLDEFGKLEDAFLTLVQNLNDHISAENQLKLDNQNLEMELLQALFSPHFLYNTLSAIKIASRDNHVGKVIDSLVHYYRITLSKGKDVIPLGDEVEMVREYVKIQQFAYDVSIAFVCELDSDVSTRLIPKLTLQPFIENAILHGINDMEEGKIWLSVKQMGEHIQIHIKDNGAGMTPDQVKSLTEGAGKGQYTGYGVANAVRRLNMFFPENSGVSIQSVPDMGTEIILYIPQEN